MAIQQLQDLKETHIKRLTENYNSCVGMKSTSTDKLKALQENLKIWGDFLKSINDMSKDFVDDLNSDPYSTLPHKDREDINEDFRQEVANFVLSHNRKFMLNE